MQHKLKYWMLALLGLALFTNVDAARVTPSSRLSSQVTSAGAKTNTVSIPSGTTTALITFYFGAAGSNKAPTSVSLDGQTATKKVSIEIGGLMNIAMYAATGMSTGASKTLAWTNDASGYTALDIGIEYRDGTVTYGASDSDACNACGSLTTVSLTNASGDELLCAYGDNGGTLTGSGSGQTTLDDTSGASDYGYSTKTGTGAGTMLSFTYSAGLQGYACQVMTTTAAAGNGVNPMDGPTRLYRIGR